MGRRLTRAEILRIIEEDQKQMEAEIAAHPERYDPEWLRLREQSMRANRLLMDRLRECAGVYMESINDFAYKGLSREEYHRALPVLLEALRDPEMEPIKDGIVWMLSVKEARGVAAQPLIEEFKRLDVPPQEPQLEGERDRYGLLIRDPTPEERRVIRLWHLKWEIGNALSVVADERVIGEIMALLRDKRHGGTRDALVWALVRLKPPGTKELLLELLDDEDDGVAIQASLALGRLGVQEARDKIEKRFLCHRDSWFRQQAKRALAKLDKAKEGNLSPPAP